MSIKSSISEQVKDKVSSFHRGKVFTAQDINIKGKHETISRSLSRMVEIGVLKRVIKGVYYKPKQSTLFKNRVLPPDLNKALKAISIANKEKIQIHGAIAVNRLGISTQIPMTEIYYTTGHSRELRIGGSKVKFVHTSNKAMFESKIPEVGMAVAAMQYLGKELVNENVVKCIRTKLTEEQYALLINLPLTAWMKLALNGKNCDK